MNEKFSLRSAFHHLPSARESLKIVGHDVSDATLSGVGTSLAFHPFSGPFFVAGGLRLISASLEQRGVAQFSGGLQAHYQAQVDYQPVAPIVSVGYKTGGQGAHLYVEFGAMLLRERSTALHVDPVIAPHPTFQPMIDAMTEKYVEAESGRVRRMARQFGIYPLIGVQAVIPF